MYVNFFCSLINLCAPKALCKEGKSHHEAVKVSFRYNHDNTEHNLRAVLTLGLVSVKECKQCSHAFSKGLRDTHTMHNLFRIVSQSACPRVIKNTRWKLKTLHFLLV